MKRLLTVMARTERLPPCHCLGLLLLLLLWNDAANERWWVVWLFSRHYKNEAEVMLEANWRVRLEELTFETHDRRGMTRTGSRVSLFRVS